MSVENRAIETMRKFFIANGWAVSDVSRVRGEHSGYDFVISKQDATLKVEVKGSEKLMSVSPIYIKPKWTNAAGL